MQELETENLEGIAIIGLAGRLPGARTIDQFWQNLCNGVESITFFSEEELIESGLDPQLVQNPNYVKAGGILGYVDQLDAGFFGLHPREAALMDPQHRIFLECAWEAFESAGYSPDIRNGRVGVFAGQSMNTYLLSNVYSHLDHVASAESLQASIGNDKDSLTTEVAYRLNLTGPAVTIQTSSSTSLVAIHYACQSLLSYECDVALAGGVSLHFPEKAGYLYHEGGTTSPDGHCRAFDAKAKGFVAGQGAGVVVLKRVAAALQDGDTIHAIIKGSAVNNDGAVKVSYMAPSIDGQAEVIALAQAIAEVEPEQIGYIEAHGTGTLVGDPIEVTALTQAFQIGTDKKGFCAIGSAKPNIGHLDTAAGVIGLIKAALVLKHKLIPPSLHFEEPNPNIDFANSPFYVNTKLTEWQTNGTPRIAGVSSFGMGGTNAHAVLEEAPAVQPSSSSRPAHLILLSAKTDAALQKMTDNLVDHLCLHSDLNLADVAYTLHVGRKRFSHRRMLVCHDLNDALTALESCDPERVFTSYQEPRTRPVMFMFSGQGAQYVNMGRGLYEQEPLFREHIDTCCELLKPHLGFDLREVLYPPEGQEEEATERLKQTAITQPAIFVIEYALARLWMEWGLQPEAMIGHSIGEYVAACLAGVFSLEDALDLVSSRGRLMQQMKQGTMLAVPLTEEEVQPFLNEQVSLAAVNSPSNCVLSGTDEAIEALQRHLDEQGLKYRYLHTSHAFHSVTMEPVLPLFRKLVQGIQLNVPTIPFVSNVSGTWITGTEATDPGYWAQHLRQAVRFADGIRELLQEPDAILLEVGPGQTLSTLTRQQPDKNPDQAILSSLRHPRSPQPDTDFLFDTLGRLWMAGAEIDWPAFYAYERRLRVVLPTYPFERQRYWIEPAERQTSSKKARSTLTSAKLDVADWFYLPSWKQTLLPEPLKAEDLANEKTHWLLFGNNSDQKDGGGLSDRLVQQLIAYEQDVVTVTAGPHFTQIDDHHFALDPKSRADYVILLQELTKAGRVPDRIIHLWGATLQPEACTGIQFFDTAQALGFYSLLFLAQSLDDQQITMPVQIVVVTSNVHPVNGVEVVHPEKVTVLGPCRVIPQEYPHIKCKCIDVRLPPVDSWLETKLADHLLAECVVDHVTDPMIAYRGQQRQVQTFEAIRLDGDRYGKARLRENGVYLITGGLGNIGFILAEKLTSSVQARLVLIGRSQLPERTEWERWLETHDEQDSIGRKIHQVRALEVLGAEVLVLNADVADREQMKTAIERAQAQFGPIHGVIHAAGEVSQRMFQAIKDTKPADVQATFRTRIQSLAVLKDVLQGQTLDFCLLTSSLASVLGGLGLATYSAANSFIDAFAHEHNPITPWPWISANWDAWQVTAEEEQRLSVGNPFAELAITAAEGANAFQRILAMEPVIQLVVSTSNLQARIDRWIRLEPIQEQKQTDTGTLPRVSRPNLQTTYVAPRNAVEQAIAKVWQDKLGLEQVGIYDNFFELGGNSLVGVQVIAQLQDELGIQIPAVSLYEGPTIKALTELIQRDKEEEPSYEQSKSRGERRRERMRQRRGKRKE